VRAPGAERAAILYRPVVESDQYLELKRLDAPSDRSTGEFAAKIRLPADFAGDVWAQASYTDGGQKDSNMISLATTAAGSQSEAPPNGPSSGGAGPSSNNSASSPIDKSALSDEITHGTVEQGPFQPAQPDVRLDVNVPAFQLCLWQNGKLVKL